MRKSILRTPAPDAPLWVVAPWFTVSFVLAFAAWRGARVAVPLAVVAAFVWSPNPWALLAIAIALYGLVLTGAALSGLVFAAVFPPLLRVPRVGRFLAFFLSSIPYVATVAYAIAVARGSPWQSFPGPPFVFATLFVSIAIAAILATTRD